MASTPELVRSLFDAYDQGHGFFLKKWAEISAKITFEELTYEIQEGPHTGKSVFWLVFRSVYEVTLNPVRAKDFQVNPVVHVWHKYRDRFTVEHYCAKAKRGEDQDIPLFWYMAALHYNSSFIIDDVLSRFPAQLSPETLLAKDKNGLSSFHAMMTRLNQKLKILFPHVGLPLFSDEPLQSTIMFGPHNPANRQGLIAPLRTMTRQWLAAWHIVKDTIPFRELVRAPSGQESIMSQAIELAKNGFAEPWLVIWDQFKKYFKAENLMMVNEAGESVLYRLTLAIVRSERVNRNGTTPGELYSVGYERLLPVLKYILECTPLVLDEATLNFRPFLGESLGVLLEHIMPEAMQLIEPKNRLVKALAAVEDLDDILMCGLAHETSIAYEAGFVNAWVIFVGFLRDRGYLERASQYLHKAGQCERRNDSLIRDEAQRLNCAFAERYIAQLSDLLLIEGQDIEPTISSIIEYAQRCTKSDRDELLKNAARCYLFQDRVVEISFDELVLDTVVKEITDVETGITVLRQARARLTSHSGADENLPPKDLLIDYNAKKRTSMDDSPKEPRPPLSPKRQRSAGAPQNP